MLMLDSIQICRRRLDATLKGLEEQQNTKKDEV
jgi:hypothetical protein